MKKKAYDLSKVENELKGASAFFKSPAATPITPIKAPALADSPANPQTTSEPPATDRRQPVVTSRRHDVTDSPAGLDINQETASHDTLRLAVNETKELEALKSALKWEHDLTVSKNDICRVALHALLEDYRTKGATSDAVKRLRKKQGRH